jgi:hypothetical protein
VPTRRSVRRRPVCLGARATLKDCHQTTVGDEVLISARIDDSREIMARWDEAIRPVYKSNGGLVSAWNARFEKGTIDASALARIALAIVERGTFGARAISGTVVDAALHFRFSGNRTVSGERHFVGEATLMKQFVRSLLGCARPRGGLGKRYENSREEVRR